MDSPKWLILFWSAPSRIGAESISSYLKWTTRDLVYDKEELDAHAISNDTNEGYNAEGRSHPPGSLQRVKSPGKPGLLIRRIGFVLLLLAHSLWLLQCILRSSAFNECLSVEGLEHPQKSLG